MNSKLNVDINVDPFAAPQANKTKSKLKHLAITAPSNSNKSFGTNSYLAPEAYNPTKRTVQLDIWYIELLNLIFIL